MYKNVFCEELLELAGWRMAWSRPRLQAVRAKDLALEELVGLRQQLHAPFEVVPDAVWLHKQPTIWAKETQMLALPFLAPFLKNACQLARTHRSFRRKPARERGNERAQQHYLLRRVHLVRPA